MQSVSCTVALLSLLAGWALPAGCDLRIEMLETKETESLPAGERWVSEERVLIELGDGIARLDRGDDFSCILYAAEGEMRWVDHQDQTVAHLELPVRLEALVQDPRLRSALRLFQRQPKLLDKRREPVRGHESELYRWSLEAPEAVTFSAWMVDLPMVDEELFALLQESCSFLEPHLPILLRQLHTHSGTPYRLRTERQSSRFSVRETLEIMDRIEFQASSDTYRPPETYSTVPFDASRYISFVGGPGP